MIWLLAATVGFMPLAASVRCKIQFCLLYLPIYLIFPSEYTHPLPASSFDEPLGGAQGKARQKNHQIFKTVGNYILITQNFPHDIKEMSYFPLSKHIIHSTHIAMYQHQVLIMCPQDYVIVLQYVCTKLYA